MLIEYMKEAYPNFQAVNPIIDLEHQEATLVKIVRQEQLPEVHDLQEFYKEGLAKVWLHSVHEAVHHAGLKEKV